MIEFLQSANVWLAGNAVWVVSVLVGTYLLSLFLKGAKVASVTLGVIALLCDVYVLYFVAQALVLAKPHVALPSALQSWGLPLASLIGLALLALVGIIAHLHNLGSLQSAGKGS